MLFLIIFSYSQSKILALKKKRVKALCFVNIMMNKEGPTWPTPVLSFLVV